MPLIRKVSTSSGTVSAIAAGNDRQTFIPSRPTRAQATTWQYPAKGVAAIIATNSRQTRVV